QAIIGSSRYHDYKPDGREIEIGYTFLDRAHWGGKYNAEMKRLMLDHAFQFVESVVFSVGRTNLRSQKALEKIGAIKTDRIRTAALRGKQVEHLIYEIKKPR